MDYVDVGVGVCGGGEGGDFGETAALVAVAEAMPNYEGEGGEVGGLGLRWLAWEGR